MHIKGLHADYQMTNLSCRTTRHMCVINSYEKINMPTNLIDFPSRQVKLLRYFTLSDTIDFVANTGYSSESNMYVVLSFIPVTLTLCTSPCYRSYSYILTTQMKTVCCPVSNKMFSGLYRSQEIDSDYW